MKQEFKPLSWLAKNYDSNANIIKDYVELADTMDLKSLAINSIRVQHPSVAPLTK